MIRSLIAALALIGLAGSASAIKPIKTTPTIGATVIKAAKAFEKANKVTKPRYDVTFSKSGKSGRVTISGIGWVLPGHPKGRVEIYNATFRINPKTGLKVGKFNIELRE